MNSLPVVFVWVGKKPPAWWLSSVSWAKKNNPENDFWIVTNSTALGAVPDWLNVFRPGEDVLDAPIEGLRYQGSFWRNSSLRFWALAEWCRTVGAAKFFHAELDNALFSLSGLGQSLDRLGVGLFVPRDAPDRALASLMYCNRPASFGELVGLYQKPGGIEHDMHALGVYSDRFPQWFHALPTESYREYAWDVLSPKKTGGVFDAAAIGQYLFGAAPDYREKRIPKTGYVNENSKVDWSAIRFRLTAGALQIQCGENDSWYVVYNVHLHAKNWKTFFRFVSDPARVAGINAGERVPALDLAEYLKGYVDWRMRRIKRSVLSRLGGQRRRSV